MLHLYQSNRLEDIYAMMSTVFRVNPLSHPLKKETIVVQSKGMGRWLNFQLAKDHGIAANIDYLLPASFFWKLLNQMLGEQKRRSAYSPEVLTFRIFKWLGQTRPMHDMPAISAYLKEGTDFRRYELAARLADGFDQYLVYRPDWLMAWEAGGKQVSNYRGEWMADADAIWQSQLWRELLAEHMLQESTVEISSSKDYHRAHTLAHLRGLIDRGEGVARLPERISLIGISALPPVYMDLLKRLSHFIDIFFFALNPCAESWGSILDASTQEFLAGDADPAELYLDVGHPLLASWGKQGRDFFDSLSEEAALHSVFDRSTEPCTLLAYLQRDILDLFDRGEADRITLNSNDRSVQIHCCHSEMREIEVLHDQLLLLFAEYPEWEPADIVVLTPDIQRYEPYIEAIFAPHDNIPTIPYAIADISTAYHSALAKVFLSLLGLAQSRFLADEVLEWLEFAAIRQKFGIQEEDISLIHHWVAQTNIRWGRDGAHKAELGLPLTEQNTWREGLTRMLLGIALPNAVSRDGFPLYQNCLPYDEIEGQASWCVARLSQFLETLFAYATLFSSSHSLSAWSDHIFALLNDCFEATSDEDRDALKKIKELLVLLKETAVEANYQGGVDDAVIRAWFSQQLASQQAGGGFLTGGVTFCTMVPMRSLPFKVICILGMTDEAFPRRHRPSAFDLMARYPRKGDRSRRADDRFLFLETLLSAREVLYVSYVGRDIRTDQEQPPSILVSDLIHVIERGFQLSNAIIYRHALQPFDPRYFSGNKYFSSYSPSWCMAAERVGRGVEKSQLMHCHSAVSIESNRPIECAELLDAVVNPTRYLLQHKCGFTEPRFRAELETKEPFLMEYGTSHYMRAKTYVQLERQEGVSELAKWTQWAHATGRLPHGEWGARLYQKEARLMRQLYTQALRYMEEPVLDSRAWVFESDTGFQVYGWLRDWRSSGRVVVLQKKLTPYYLMSAWLDHLAMCWMDCDDVLVKRTLFLSISDSDPIHIFHPCSSSQAMVYWEQLLSVYGDALCRPLPLFRKTSSTFASSLVDAAKKGKELSEVAALKKAKEVWDPSFGDYLGELADDAWLSRVWAGIDPTQMPWQLEFMARAKAVWMPLYEHLDVLS